MGERYNDLASEVGLVRMYLGRIQESVVVYDRAPSPLDVLDAVGHFERLVNLLENGTNDRT